jgi:nitrite reductase (cytochrome c-552)
MADTPESNANRPSRLRWAVYLAALFGVALLTVLVLLLLQNIAQRKEEAKQTVFQIVPLNETVEDPATWGINYPLQYDSYLRTVDVVQTKHGGSEAFQKLDQFPLWRTIFAGYAFSIDYREERGHAYMLSDQRETERVTLAKQFGACLQCHASNTVAYRKVGLELGAPGELTDPLLSEAGLKQLHAGFEKVCGMDYFEATKLVDHPVSCIECHDPKTMALRVTRPGFMTGIAAFATSDESAPHLPSIERWRTGDRAKPYDPNALASRQEMRSMVCGQCHVEYYFKGKTEKIVTYPWAKGFDAEDIEAYYDEIGFSDWTHKVSGAGVLKAQHPEFELWSKGIHARSGVSCADCHMPYQRVGAVKVSSHHVRSPVLNVASSCQTCHNFPEEELVERIYTIQDRTARLMRIGEYAVTDLINAIAAGKQAGLSDEQLAAARKLQRQSQWRLDFIAAENSMGFHADQEAARILGEAAELARRGQVVLANLGVKTLPTEIPPHLIQPAVSAPPPAAPPPPNPKPMPEDKNRPLTNPRGVEPTPNLPAPTPPAPPGTSPAPAPAPPPAPPPAS